MQPEETLLFDEVISKIEEPRIIMSAMYAQLRRCLIAAIVLTVPGGTMAHDGRYSL